MNAVFPLNSRTKGGGFESKLCTNYFDILKKDFNSIIPLTEQSELSKIMVFVYKLIPCSESRIVLHTSIVNTYYKKHCHLSFFSVFFFFFFFLFNLLIWDIITIAIKRYICRTNLVFFFFFSNS